MKLTFASLAALALFASCMATGRQDFSQPPRGGPSPQRGTAQGWIGISELETRDISTSSNQGDVVEIDDATMPSLGGVFQTPLGGEKVIFGIEGGLSFGWQGSVNAIAVGNGGVAISADSDVFLLDFFGGPYIAIPLGQRLRLYGATGLMLEWGWFDIDWNDPVFGSVSYDQDGLGGGYYGRTGLELYMGNGAWIGLGLRVADTSVNPGGEIDTVELRQIQYLFTLTRTM